MAFYNRKCLLRLTSVHFLCLWVENSIPFSCSPLASSCNLLNSLRDVRKVQASNFNAQQFRLHCRRCFQHRPSVFFIRFIASGCRAPSFGMQWKSCLPKTCYKCHERRCYTVATRKATMLPRKLFSNSNIWVRLVMVHAELSLHQLSQYFAGLLVNFSGVFE